MFPAALTNALARLDRRLLAVCDAEERRARRLVGDGTTGWDGVRSMIRPDLAEIALPPATPAEPLAGDDHPPLRLLSEAAGLSPVERDIVLLALAPHVEPRYQAVYAVLQDDLNQPLPTERLLRAVLGAGDVAAPDIATALGEGGPLRRTGILSTPASSFPPLARPYELAGDVAAALLGQARPSVAAARGQRWTQGRGDAGHTPAFLVIFGAGDRAADARRRVGADTTLLEVGLPADHAAALQAALSAWRVGSCTGALPLLDTAALIERDRTTLADHLATLMREIGGRVWLLSHEALPLTVPQIPVAAATWAERRDTWVAAARDRGVALGLDAAGRLAARHRFAGEEIARVLEAAAAYDEAELDATAAGMSFAHVERSNLTIPTRSFDDLVLRDTTREALQRLLFYVRHRDRVALERGLGARHRVERGPLVLFSGRSGTGKTLAAEALAGALQRPLHTIDLARLVSKYIGETEQHIDQVLTQAERGSAVLFFDEADAIFANRVEKASSSAEQFANMLVGYLLQRIEAHDGLVILATNLLQAIDDAFLRRFQFRIEFPMPEPDERARIWDLLLPDGDARGDDLDLKTIGRVHRLAGGDIRNAALKAVFLAEQRGDVVRQEDLERAIALEMLEMGRLSRRPVEEHESDGRIGPDRGALLRRCLDEFHDQLESYLRARFLKEIHIVHGSPTEEQLAGRRPAVSLALFRIAAGRSAAGLRAGFIISTWSAKAEEESELLGVVHELLSLVRLEPVEGRAATIRLQESHDFDLLHRFWTSHNHPVRPSLVVDVDLEE